MDSSLKSLKVNKDNLVITKPNPRFSGINLDPMDVSVYGTAIEEMFNSMVETYKNTNSLLVQPIAVQYADGIYNVVAGYTRALTYLTRYEDLLKATGTTELSIPVNVFDNFTSSETLSENLVRNNQHFMATAISIGNILSNYKGKARSEKISSLCRQLNISNNTMHLYNRMNLFHNDIKKLCYTGVISHDAALEFAKLDNNIYKAIEEHILEDLADNNIDNNTFEDAQDVRRYMRVVLTLVDTKKCPVNSFVDVDGNYHPAITELKYIIGSVDPLFPELYSIDNDAYMNRIKAYWESVAVKFGKPVAEYNYNMSSSDYEEVEMGTHPDELAMWNYNKDYIHFYIKKNTSNKFTPNYVETVKDKVQERADSKFVSIRAKIRKEYIFNEVYRLSKDEDTTIIPSTVYKTYFTMRLYGLSKDELSSFQAIINVSGTIEDIISRLETCKYTGTVLLNGYNLLDAILLAQLSCYTNVTGDLKEFLDINNIDYDGGLESAYQEADKMYDEIIAKGLDKVETAQKQTNSIQEYAQFLFNTYVVDKDILGNMVLNNHYLPENVLKSICKNMGVSFKGDIDVIRKRLISAVSMVIQNYNINVINEEAYNSITELCSSLNTIIFDNVSSHECNLTGNNVKDIFELMVESACQLGYLDYENVKDIKFGYKNLLQFANTEEAESKFMYEFFKKTNKYSNAITVAFIDNDKLEIFEASVS